MANRSINEALTEVIRNFSQMKQRFQQSMQQRRGDQLAGRALAALKHVPGKPTYPIRWTSDKQRKAFFASKGFGRGIPAGRNNPPDVSEGWDAEFIATDDGGVLALSNSEPHWVYVQGAYAQGFHKDTGWVQIDDVREDAWREMESVAIAEWFETADPLEGV